VPTLWTGEIPKSAKIEQVWFAGAHSDVGGGYITRKLADIPLVWMARKAEQDGLVLDWSCLPDPKALSRESASHDSRTLLYAKDRIVPTFRQVCAQAFQVPFYQRLYAPTDGSGRPLPIINEAVHQSVLDRYGTHAPTCTSDPLGTCTNDLYRPANVAALFDGEGRLKTQVKVEPY
jgi:hypothetical protein